MAVLRDMMDSGTLTAEQYDALEYVHELALEDLIAEAQYTQDEAVRLKEDGMLN